LHKPSVLDSCIKAFTRKNVVQCYECVSLWLMDSPDSLSSRFLPKPKLYRAKYPNQPILLYKSFSEIIQGKDVFEGQAVALLMWFPHPHVKFEFTASAKLQRPCGFCRLLDNSSVQTWLRSGNFKTVIALHALLDVISVQVASAS